MLLRHSALYLLARGVPGIVNFLSVAIYTRVLSPDEYGRYALAIAGVGLFNVIFFQWLRLSLLRFLPAHLPNPKELLSAVLGGYVGTVLVTTLLGILTAVLWPDGTLRELLLMAIPLSWAQSWFDLNLVVARSNLQPRRYGMMSGVKAVSALCLGSSAVFLGLGAEGLLLGLLAALLIASVLLGSSQWRGIIPKLPPDVMKRLFGYGLPFTATFALSFIVSSSDRFLIAWFLGEGAAGVYSASYNLTQQSLTLLMMIVNTASYPLIVRALEIYGEEAARRQLLKNAELLFGVAFPSTVGLIVLAPNVAAVSLGSAFQEEASNLMPLIAVATLMEGIRAFHFDVAFQLGQRTVGQVWVMGGAAAVNFALNFWWIPKFGLMGAAWATVIAYAVALTLSANFGRKIFVIPFEWRTVGKLIAAATAMIPILVVGTMTETWVGLLGAGFGAVFVYALLLVTFDAGGLRFKLLGMLRRYKHEP